MHFRTLLNSPLLRRKKKSGNSFENDSKANSATESHQATTNVDLTKLIVEDSDSDEELTGNNKDHYHNLETFQKKKLKQKLKNLNNMSSSGPYPSPPPAPQRVPHPRKNLQHSAGLLQPPTPLLPRRALHKGVLGSGLHPGATPNSTPIPTPNTKRRGLNGLLQQYHQQQNQVSVLEFISCLSMIVREFVKKC